VGVRVLCVEGGSGPKLDWAYEFVNWYLSGWAGAYLNRQGYIRVLSTPRQHAVS